MSAVCPHLTLKPVVAEGIIEPWVFVKHVLGEIRMFIAVMQHQGLAQRLKSQAGCWMPFPASHPTRAFVPRLVMVILVNAQYKGTDGAGGQNLW